MKRTKRFLCVLLTLSIILGLIPYTAFASSRELPFTDVDRASWYYEAVQYVYENGMMNGTSNATFSPNVAITRGMIVTVLHRMEGSPSTSGTAFADVAEGQWYTSAVTWANAHNIVDGYGDGTFGPNNNITREQMAAILYRYAQYKGHDMNNTMNLSTFTDADSVSMYAVTPMQWAVANGLISGVGNNTLAPKGDATRSQAAAILMRYCKNVSKTDSSAPSKSELYTVIFDLNYGQPREYNTQTVMAGKTVEKPAAPDRNGYSFNGWYTKKSGGSQFDFNTKIISNLTLYAHWTATSGNGSVDGTGNNPGSTPDTQYCTVTFFANGSDVNNLPQAQQIRVGAYATMPEAPNRKGYLFAGWYCDSSCLNVFDFSSAVTNNIALYAKWTPKSGDNTQYRVTFMLNDGSQCAHTMQVVELNGYATKPDDPQWGAYTFNGWYTDEESATKYDFTAPITRDLTLYAGWTRTNDIISSASGGETVYSITGLQMQGDQVEVTINVNSACTLEVEFLSEDETTLLSKISVQTPEYCELMPVCLPVTGSLPEYYLIRAVLQDSGGNDLCAPFTTIEYTSVFANFDDLSVLDFSGKTVLNFDKDLNNNFGVLSDTVKIILSTQTSNTLETEMYYSEDEAFPTTVYKFTNADDTVDSLNSGDKVYIRGSQHLFRVDSIRRNGATVEITSDVDTKLSDFYDVLQVDTSATSGKEQPRSVRDVPPTIDLIELGTTIDVSQGFSEELNWTSGTSLGVSGEIRGTFSPTIKIQYDAEHLGQEYFFISFVVDSDTQTSLQLTGSINKSFEGLKVYLPSSIPGLVWYTQPALFVECSLSAGATASFSEKSKLGFAYGSYVGFETVDKKQLTSDIDIQGAADIRFGFQLTQVASFCGKGIQCEMTERIGPHFELSAHIPVDGTVSRHACTLCMDGHAKWFYDIGTKFSYCIIPGVLDGSHNKKLLEAEIPMSLINSELGECYFSIMNDEDSIHGGKPKFGGGTCPNRVWQTIITVSEDHENFNVPVEVWRAGRQVGLGVSPYTVYLYDGEYTANAGIGTEKRFIVNGAPQNVSVEINTPLVHTVTFYTDEGGSATSDFSIPAGEMFTLPACMFEATNGKKFKSWLYNGQEYLVGEQIGPITTNVAVYAIWEDDVQKPEEYTITFLANGGSGTMGSITLECGLEYTLPSCSFTPPEGHIFDCWEIDGQQYDVGYQFTIAGDIVVSAVWGEPKESYTITYDDNYGGGNVQTVAKYAGDTIGSTPTPTRDGYVFMSWNTAVDGAGTEASYYTPVNSDLTFYAQWGRKVGDFVVMGESGYSYSDGVLYITGTNHLTIRNIQVGGLTTDRIEIADGVSANITLAGVYIDARDSDAAAISIADNSVGDVSISLANGKRNTLYSAKKHPALEKSGKADEIGTLTINGPGALNAYGGMYSPGIGSTTLGLRNLVINGGRIYSEGGKYGSGIGCSTDYGWCRGNVQDLTINGGEIFAYAGPGGGAGIGNGFTTASPGPGPQNIFILGGTVYAAAGWVNTNRGDYIGAAIGSGAYVDALGQWASQGVEYSKTENWHGTVTRVRGSNSTTTVY